MTRYLTFTLLAVACTLSLAAFAQTAVVVSATNPTEIPRPHETLEIDYDPLVERLPALADAEPRVRLIGAYTIPSQRYDADGDGTADVLLFQGDFGPRQTLSFHIDAEGEGAQHPAPVRAMVVAHNKDDMAWESELFAARLYGPGTRDELVSNGLDVWLKRVRYPILEKWYAPGHNYHHDEGEGADLFKVGRSLGGGSEAIWHAGAMHTPADNFVDPTVIDGDGPVRAAFELTYPEWTVDGKPVMATKRGTIDAGHALTRWEVTYECAAESMDVVLGVVKRPDTWDLCSVSMGWATLWGPVSADPAQGELGTGVVAGFGRAEAVFVANDHVLLKTQVTPGQPLVYWSGYGWTLAGEFESIDDWATHLSHWAVRAAMPLEVSLMAQ